MHDSKHDRSADNYSNEHKESLAFKHSAISIQPFNSIASEVNSFGGCHCSESFRSRRFFPADEDGCAPYDSLFWLQACGAAVNCFLCPNVESVVLKNVSLAEC